MDTYARSFYNLKYENQYLKLRGNAFQDFFATIMEMRFPGDFVRVRPWGRHGDRKNDGYVRSLRHLFQVYAPNEMTERDACRKIDEDFHGALPYWQQYFDSWVFVHNSVDGLGPGIVRKLLEIEEVCEHVHCTHWGMEELRLEVFRLSERHLESLFGPAPSTSAIREVRFDDLSMVIHGLEQLDPPSAPDLRPVPDDKLQQNHLSREVMELLTLGMMKADLVGQFFDSWIDPELGDRIAAALQQHYAELRDMGTPPNRIFEELWEGARNGQPRRAKSEAAVLAVLAHLFESCDIFERTSETR